MRIRSRFLCAAGLISLLAATSCSREGPAPVRSYNLGDRVDMGRLAYTVYEGQWLPQIGEGTAARIPQHRFFTLRLNVANASSAEIMAPNVALQDDSGNTFDELSNGDGVTSWLGFVRRVKAGETLTGNIVFDVPPRHYRLVLTDGASEATALVDIPLSFADSSPAVPAADFGKK